MRLAPLVLSLTLVLGGCSLFGGGDDGSSAPRAKDAESSALPLRDVDRKPRRDVAAGGTLRLATPVLPANLNPWQVDGLRDDAADLLEPTSGQVVRPDDRGGWALDRDHARSVRVVRRAPLTIAVALNPEARWQDGKPVESRDMVAFARAMSGRDSAYQVGSADGWDDIARVERRGRFGYRVVFSTSRSDWPRFVSPRLPRSVTASARTFNRGFTGRAVPSNGPFVVSRVERRTGTLTMTRNPRWWGTTPRLARISVRVAAPDVAVEALAAGELDAATLTEDTVKDAPDDDVTVRRSAGTRIAQLTLNGGRGALRDAAVRRAVALAVDRDALARRQAAALGTRPVVASSLLVAPGQPGYRAAREVAPDLDAARKALRDAGYRVGDTTTKGGKPLRLRLPVPSDDPVAARRAASIARSLDALGIEVRRPEVKAADYYTSVLVPLDFDLALITWDASPLGVASAEARFRPVTSPLNFTGVGDDHAAAWARASREQSTKARRAAVRRLDRVLLADRVALPLLGQPQVAAVADRVANYGVTAASPLDWTAVGFRE